MVAPRAADLAAGDKLAAIGGTMSRFTESTDYGWPSLRIAAGPAELVFVPVLGGRLMGIRLDGEELLWVNPELAGRTPDLDNLPAAFPLWGGEKTWIAPQSDWPENVPSPDLDSGAYAVEQRDGRLVLTSAICRRTGLQIVRTFDVGSDGSWTTRHTIRNRGERTTFAGPWTVMMINRDTRFFIPGEGEPVYMYYRPGYDGRLETLTQVDCYDTTVFKTGHRLAEGWFAAFLPRADGRAAMIAQYGSPTPNGGRWAHGHPAEVYNSAQYPYCEMELHGPGRDLAPGEELSWDMRTKVAAVDAMPATEAAVRRAVL